MKTAVEVDILVGMKQSSPAAGDSPAPCWGKPPH